MPLEEYKPKGGKKNGEDQLVTRKTRGGNLAEAGESNINFLVQRALCHHPVGKVGYEFKIARSLK